MAALKQPTIRVVAIIAEGVPEADTKQLIAYARSNNKVTDEMLFLSLASIRSSDTFLNGNESAEENDQAVN